jgi:GMP synthase (glutamine-hydrolysing)
MRIYITSLIVFALSFAFTYCKPEIVSFPEISISAPFAISTQSPSLHSLLSGKVEPVIPDTYPEYVLAAFNGSVVKQSHDEVILQHVKTGLYFYTVYSGIYSLSFDGNEQVNQGSLIGRYNDSFNFEIVSAANFKPIEAEDLDERLNPLDSENIQLKDRNLAIAILNPTVNPDKLTMVNPVAEIIETYTSHNVETVHYLEYKFSTGYDAVIITGQSTPWEEYDMSDFIEVEKLLESDTPILGICGGHQLIVLLSGGKVDLIDTNSCDKQNGYTGCFKKRGFVDVLINSDDLLFTGYSNEEQFYASHCEHVTELPEDFITLAETEFSPVYAFKHRSKPHYGVQFHPELPKENNSHGKNVILNFMIFIAD